MRRTTAVRRRWVGLAVGLSLLSAASPATAQDFFGFGFVDIIADATGPLQLDGTVQTCVHSQVLGIPIAGGMHEDGSGPVAPSACSIMLTAAPFDALGPLAGEGVSSTSPFPEEEILSYLSDPNAEALAASLTSLDLTGPTPSWAASSIAATTLGETGVSVARTTQTFLVTAPASAMFSLFVEATALLQGSGLGRFSSADLLFESVGAFGVGSMPGVGQVGGWSFTRQISGNDFLDAGEILLDDTFPLQANQTYWLTTSTVAAAALGPATVTPEPASMLLLGFGLAGVAALRRRGVRRGRGAG